MAAVGLKWKQAMFDQVWITIGSVKGEIAALVSALTWAVASAVYSRIGRSVFPAQMNLLKNVLAALMLFVTILIVDRSIWIDGFQFHWLLLASGAVGLGLGDTLYFEAFEHIGVRKALLFLILSPPMAGVIALIFLGEAISIPGWIGILITISGVGWVILERTPTEVKNDRSSNFRKGVILAFLSAVTQAVGAVLSHTAMIQTHISALQSAWLRLIGGALIAAIWMKFQSGPKNRLGLTLSSLHIVMIIFFTALFGTTIGIWLQQFALRYTAAGIAQTFFSTSPIFILPIMYFMGEKISFRALLGAVIAVIGIGLLFEI